MATWYVRPDTSHSGTRNGTSYATAWGGWSEIVWGVGGVTAGDDLFVCGVHTRSAATAVGNHGGTTANRVTIRGDFALDPGAITLVGNIFFHNFRANTILRNLTITAGTSHCIFIQGLATNCDYVNNIFISNAATTAFSIYADNGENHTDVLIQGNTFRATGAGMNPGLAPALEWLMAVAGGTSTLTRLKIRNNLFIDCNSSGACFSVMQLRSEQNVGAGTTITDLEIDGNVFRNYRGSAIRVHAYLAQNSNNYGVFKGVKVRNNEFYDGAEAVTAGFGGGMSVANFAPSTTFGWGANEISGNKGYRLKGAVGGVNIWYGTFYVANNYFEDLSTGTIDGNGVLVDWGCDDVLVVNNRFKNLTGKAGVFNSGCGIMVLDSTNVRCYGNVGENMRIGLFIGDQNSPSRQSARLHNNTMWGCTEHAIYLTHNVAVASVSMYNNTFQGTGYKVYNATTNASVWSLENYNNFDGFALGTFQHTLGANDMSVAMAPIVRSDGSLKVPSTATLATVGTDNPLATSGTYVGGVTLRNGRLRPGYTPIGAYMAVLPRAARA